MLNSQEHAAQKIAEYLSAYLDLEIVSNNLFNCTIAIGEKLEHTSHAIYVISYNNHNGSYIDNKYYQMLPHRLSIRTQDYSATLSTKDLLTEYSNNNMFALETVHDLSTVKPLLEAVPIEVLCTFFEIKL